MRILYFLFILFLGNVAAVAQQSITLENCFEAALEQHPTTEQTQLIEQELALQQRAIVRNYFPKLSFNAQATWQSAVTSVEVPLPGVEIPSPPKDQYRATLDLQQTIWDGGRTVQQKKMAAAAAHTEQKKLQVEQWKIKQQVQQFYFNSLLMDQQLVQLQLSQEDLQRKKEQLEVAVENEITPPLAVWQFNLRLIELAQQRQQLSMLRRSARKGLQLLTELEIDSSTLLQIPENQPTLSNQIQRPEISLFNSNQELLQRQIDLNKVKQGPKLFAFAQGGYGRPGLNMLATDFEPFFIGGIKLHVPLDRIYTKKTKFENQQLELKIAKIAVQQQSFELATNVQVEQQKEQLKYVQKLLTTDQEMLQVQEKIMKSAEQQLDNEVTIATDYLQELSKTQQLREQLALHKMQLLKISYEMKMLLGQ